MNGTPPRFSDISRLPNVLVEYRRVMVWLAHALIWAVAYGGAFLLRFDFDVPDAWWRWPYVAWLGVLIVLRTLTYAQLGQFQGIWKYTGQRDLERLIAATGISTLLFAMIVLVTSNPVPRSVLLVEPMITVGLAGGLRFSVRVLAQTARRLEAQSSRRMLLVGSGDAAEAALREITRSMPSVVCVGILDDDRHQWGMSIHGITVLGPIRNAERTIQELEVGEVVIAMPRATGRQMRKILDEVSVEGVTVRTVPALDDLVEGRLTVNQIREVDIEDLLGRDPVKLDTERISTMVEGDVVLVTGAGGSIGSELCRQICRFRPRTLVLVEQAENALYHVHRELEGRFPDVEILPRIADITDFGRLDHLFGQTRPGLVLHAAAHKHVPMMEMNPGEAIKNNVGGTVTVAEVAHLHRVARFVMISTDKAVNPTSVMGCTKRVAELYVQSQAERSDTTFVTVRFGNVLGSNGSVIPLFKSQIAKGGPVTVTHPDMQRYFMTIPEASQLVLEAGAMGQSGEIYVLDMGSAVRITTLAEDLIRLSGLQPGRDIEIVYSGIRPGEKLFEELAIDGEDATKTRHPKIYIGTGSPRPHAWMQDAVQQLLGAAKEDLVARRMLKRIVPRYSWEEAEPKPVPGSNVVDLEAAVEGRS
ncbi:MAG: nucleoside-diphosphate sugar epimerase/dehydratase [Myxococcota bacterium]